MATKVAYSVLDQCIDNLNISIDNNEISAEFSNLRSVFSKSEGATKEAFINSAIELKKSYELIQELTVVSRDMLIVAKKLYQDHDSELSDTTHIN